MTEFDVFASGGGANVRKYFSDTRYHAVWRLTPILFPLKFLRRNVRLSPPLHPLTWTPL